MIKNPKNFLAILILSLIILAAIIFLARPLIFRCLEIYKENKEKQAEIASYEKNIANIKAVESQIENISYTITKAQEFIPQDPKTNDFIVQLEAATQKSKITIKKINLEEGQPTSPSQPAEGETSQQNQPQQGQGGQTQTKSTKIIDVAGAEEQAISVELQGQYSQLISFLKNMKTLSRFNIIKNLSIQTTTEAKNENITASFYVIIFSKS